VSACIFAISLFVGIPQVGAATLEQKVKLLWWSHWAEEEPRKIILHTIAKNFMAAHPNVEVEIVWWQKTEMWPAMRNAFTAGTGFPDLFYFDAGVLEFIPAGWLADLSGLNWDQVEPWARTLWKLPGPGGKEGNWAVPIEVTTDEIYYSKNLFAKLGIAVPENYQYTAEEFYNVAKKCRNGGYNPFAQGIGDRDYPGTYITNFVLLAQLGEQGVKDLWTGKKSWKDPEVVEALQYVKRLVDIPVMPPTFSTMKLSESHIYFHTQQKACMFLVGSWYTGRAFSSPEKGGQPPDFRLGFLRYPSMPKGKGNNLKFLTPGGAIAVAEKSPHKDMALALAQAIMTEQVGNLWLEKSAIGTGLKTDPSKIESSFKWYFDEFAKTHKGQDYAIGLTWHVLMSPAMKDAYGNVVNSAFPLGQISVDEVIEEMEASRE
jgi:ABC-type glycerol-3-phosphate transport system substrate-binding protein